VIIHLGKTEPAKNEFYKHFQHFETIIMRLDETIQQHLTNLPEHLQAEVFDVER